MKNWHHYGIWLDFGENVRNIRDIKIGMKAKIIPSGRVPSGNYVMPDGSTWRFKNGVLTKLGTLLGLERGIVKFHSEKTG